MVRPCRIKAQEVTVFCGEDLYCSRGDLLLDGRLLHDHSCDPESDCWRLLSPTPATQRYKVRLCRIEAQESGNPSESGLWTNVMESLMADSSTTA